MSKFVEIITDYVDDNDVRYIDGYHAYAEDSDYEEEGRVLGYVFNRQIYWTNPDYQFDEYVKQVIKELKTENIID